MKVIMESCLGERIRLTRPAFIWVLGYVLVGIALIALSAPSVAYLIDQAHRAMCYVAPVDTR